MFELDSVFKANETIELPARDEVALARCTFESCNIIGRTARTHLTVVATVFRNCSIQWKVPLKNKTWRDAIFVGCNFTGQYLGNRFGHAKQWEGSTGMVEDCDFREAHLDGTDFLACAMSRVQLPRWPYFSLLEPVSHREELLSIGARAPAQLRATLKVSGEGYPEKSAVTWSGRELARSADMEVSELFAWVKKLPGAVY